MTLAPIEPSSLASVHGDLEADACLRELHVVSSGRVRVGWDAVAFLARLFPPTWPLGALGAVPPLRWLGQLAYRLVARNRYALSKCRGGACHVVSPEIARRRSSLGAFWSCYTAGLALRLPLIAGAAVVTLGRNVRDHVRTFRRRVPLLDGALTLVFLGSLRSDLVPIVFGERFLMVLYRGVAVDPGSTRLRRSLEAQLAKLPAGGIRAIAATHHHEEHVGNLEWLAARTGAPLFLAEETARRLRPPGRIPRMRDVIIGQPPALTGSYTPLVPGASVRIGDVTLRVFAAPGHSDDHVVLYDPERKVLLAGDAFMGAYFATPNPDVDSRRWIESLDALLALPIEVLVEGHGLVHTLRSDVPEVPGVVVRQDPREALEEKRRLLIWLRSQVEEGFADGLPLRAIEASCFPWNRTWVWERAASDELARLLSGGEFSRTELVRSFRRSGAAPFPTVYQARIRGARSGDEAATGRR